jgi:hypothetical protein
MIFIAAKPVSGVEHDRNVTMPVILRYTSDRSEEFNDMQLGAFLFYDEALIAGFAWPVPPPLILFTPSLQCPKSRGYLRLDSVDPTVPIGIHINFVNEPED